MQLKDKTALVTGAATGIGRSLAIALAREGANLALLDIDEVNGRETARLVGETGRIAEFYRADASSRESLEQAIGTAWSAQGPIALVCANAGVMAAAPLVDMDARDIDWVLRVNLLGALDTVRAWVGLVREAGTGGQLLLTGSENSVAVPHALRRTGLGLYGMTKHAILHMGDVLRYELAADGIAVSVLMPGPVRTAISMSGRNRPAEFGGSRADSPLDPRLIDFDVPLGALLEPEAVARIAIEGMRAGRFMIPTHSHILAFAEARFEELAEATRATAFEPDS